MPTSGKFPSVPYREYWYPYNTKSITASSYSIFIKSYFCNFTLWMPGAVAPIATPSARHWYYVNKLR